MCLEEGWWGMEGPYTSGLGVGFAASRSGLEVDVYR